MWLANTDLRDERLQVSQWEFKRLEMDREIDRKRPETLACRLLGVARSSSRSLLVLIFDG